MSIKRALMAAAIALTAIVGGAMPSTFAASAAAPSPSTTEVIVKPVDQRSRPDAVGYQEEIDRVLGTVTNALGGIVNSISTHEHAIAVCHANYLKGDVGETEALSQYSNCVAEPTAAMKGDWEEAAKIFGTFGKDLASLAEKTAKIQGFIAEQDKQDGEEVRKLEAMVKKAVPELQRAQEMRKSGKPLSAEQERALAILMDNALTAKANADRISRRRAAHAEKAKAHGSTRAWLEGLSADSDVLRQRASNRGQIWAGVLEDIRSRIGISVFDDQIVRLGTGLAGAGSVLSGVALALDGQPDLPDLDPREDTPVPPQPRLLTGNMDADLARVLGVLSGNGGGK